MNDQEREKLKPCPFCGDVPFLDNAQLVRDTYWWVRCTNKLCRVIPSGMQCLKKADAIAAWNTRAPLAVDAKAAAEAIRQGVVALDWSRDGEFVDKVAAIIAAHTAPKLTEAESNKLVVAGLLLRKEGYTNLANSYDAIIAAHTAEVAKTAGGAK